MDGVVHADGSAEAREERDEAISDKNDDADAEGRLDVHVWWGSEDKMVPVQGQGKREAL